MLNKATIIIPFFHEGDEILKTLQNICETCDTTNVEILLIQDDTQPTPKFPSLHCDLKYMRSPNRLGVAGCRNLGAMCAKHNNLIFLDAHMRFINNYWLNIIADEIETNPRSIITPVNKSVKDEELDLTSNSGRGCKILFKHGTDNSLDYKNHMLSTPWDEKLLFNHDKEIACVMGGCYGIKKDFFNYIDGFTGLYMMGCSEPFISLKAWMFGGNCQNIPHVVVGHKYKTQTDMVQTFEWYRQYNKMYLIYTLFPDELVEPAIKHLESVVRYTEARQLIRDNFVSIMAKRKHYQAFLKNDLHWYIEKFNFKLFEL